jgi:predicted TIM-barrel fold metal-dependent hydrolase
MYASDYPHGESHFPKSAGIVTGWDMPEPRKRKLLWDNATKLYSRAGVD